MLRSIIGFAVLAVVGIFALRVVFGLLGVAFKLMWAVLWLALIGFIVYLVLKLISPSTARRVRDTIRGEPHEP